ncbi:hypothetical protein KIPB_013755, partial [Kipferlia bialata]|eukprot:g13755.t1
MPGLQEEGYDGASQRSTMPSTPQRRIGSTCKHVGSLFPVPVHPTNRPVRLAPGQCVSGSCLCPSCGHLACQPQLLRPCGHVVCLACVLSSSIGRDTPSCPVCMGSVLGSLTEPSLAGAVASIRIICPYCTQ